jgi:SHS2 domain-containing protein
MTTISYLDHTADVGVDITAPTAVEAFVAAAEAMFDVMVDRQRVAPVQTWTVEVQAERWEDLLVVWLEELLWLYESEGMLPHDILIGTMGPTNLRAVIEGDTLNRMRDDPRVQIKAVTYHQLRAEETPEGFALRVIFDV